MSYQITYDFYKDYLYNETFQEIFDKRKRMIRDRYSLNHSDDELVREYFVEIFSWSVIPYNLLMEINKILDNLERINRIIDPCSGNSFHTFIFSEFCQKRVSTIDIQPEELSWIETIKDNGLDFIKNNCTSNDCLLLSWIDYDDLAYNLLYNFRGDMVISIGNYENISFQYLGLLESNFVLMKRYILNMPWNHTEQIKIYKRK
tara:strand:+ start:75 stop:683 length:609 start_codon:yes stop_codon:yes gene_type:complete